jgi:aryl-alcohol dehydrogenase-like predicted oxidoreductase
LLTRSTFAATGDIRARFPRFGADNRARNARLVEALETLALAKRISPPQLAIAWVLAKGRTIVPVVGTRTRAQLTESLGALAVHLSPEDVERIEAAVPASAVAGSRYDEHQMRMLDSER